MHSKNWSTGPKSNQVFQRKKKIKKKRLCHKSRVTACLSAPPAPAHWVRGAVVTAAGLSAMAAGGVEERGGLEAAVRGGLRILRERWMRGTRERSGTAAFAGPPCPSLPEDVEEVSALQALPIDVQLNIMSFLSPQDLCHLGSTSCYWRATVQDPLLWRYFLLRDLPFWTSVDWKSLPDVEIFNKTFSEDSDNALYDYMAVYKKSCPQSRRSLKSSRPRYGAVTSFLQSLVTQAEPRFAMFGPGLEELDNSLVQKMMTCPEILLVAGLLQRQIHGIGSGVSFQFNNNKKFNILTLYSTTSVERRRAREEQAVAVNKMFYQENSIVGNQQAMRYSVIAQVKKVCEVVDGFIYVANAEAHKKHDRQEELARILAMIDPALGPPNRPLLVLSCVSHIDVKRIPCVYVAHQLQLNLLRQPWMVQDTVAATLAGLMNGIEWLLEEVNCKNAQ
ncbi:F-box only protein 4 isoform X1 [Larus michahellis]